MRQPVARGYLIAVSLVACILLPATGAVASPSSANAGGIGVRLIALPSDTGAGPLARSYIVATVAPGKTLRRRVEISNTTHSAAVVTVYAAAASLHRGTFAFAAGRSPNELSDWTSVSQAVVRLPSGKATYETATINVPKDASAGSRYAVIWAAVSAPAPAGGGVTLVNRVGIRMYLSVGPGGAPPSNYCNRTASRRTFCERRVDRCCACPQHRPNHSGHQRHAHALARSGRPPRRTVPRYVGSKPWAEGLRVRNRPPGRPTPTRSLACPHAAHQRPAPENSHSDDHVPAPRRRREPIGLPSNPSPGHRDPSRLDRANRARTLVHPFT